LPYVCPSTAVPLEPTNLSSIIERGAFHKRMRRAFQLTVSLACLGVIFLGARYAVGRERLRQTDLSGLYQRVNQESFHGELPGAVVEWSVLPDKYGTTTFYSDGTVEIEIDRVSVTSEEQLMKTMEHEACNVYTRAVVVETGQDAHGEAFQNCRKRFE
jgi:hypothetical protein